MKKTKSTPRATTRRCAVSTGSGWLPASSAPKGPLILADFGWPWPVMATWSEMSGKWAAVSVQRTSEDAWFESETELSSDLRRWMPWPSFPNKQVSNGHQNTTDSIS